MAKKSAEKGSPAVAGTKYEGTIMIRGKGVGYVNLPDFEEDIMLPQDQVGVALDGDIVEIELTGKSVQGRETGKVVKILSRARSEYIGAVILHENKPHLRPDNRRIHTLFSLPSTSSHAVGMKVVAKLTKWDDPSVRPEAEIVETLGHAGDHETEMQAIIRGGGFAIDFPHDVAARAEELFATKADIFKRAEQDPKRRDYRSVATCTIDPKNAKDFDDALSFKRINDDTFEIGVHIADVSHYVEENDAIDLEAQERGTSIYLVDRVIPMLPEVLSNDLCSLRPNEDRLAFSAIFTMKKDGSVTHSWYGKTLIHSDRRFSYEDAQEVLDTGAGDMLEELSTIMELARILRAKRHKEGAIAFDQPEVVFELDDKGKPIDVHQKTRTETMLMIEDFMLLANQSVATYVDTLSKKSGTDHAFVYRIHDVPQSEKIEELGLFLKMLGYEFKHERGLVHATTINKLLKEVTGTPEENLIKTATIRSMAKAVYSTKNIGHFGLAFKFYTHFTSPIRRYPDLMVHRLLYKHLNGTPISGPSQAKYQRLAIQSSAREMDAVDAERTSIKYKQVEYMLDKVGQTFDGVITGTADWGIYVEEKRSKSEGLVRLASMKKDFFAHEKSQYRVKGQRSSQTYRLGDAVKIKLTRASLEDRTLDFELAG